jgi:hypothetical protein
MGDFDQARAGGPYQLVLGDGSQAQTLAISAPIFRITGPEFTGALGTALIPGLPILTNLAIAYDPAHAGARGCGEHLIERHPAPTGTSLVAAGGTSSSGGPSPTGTSLAGPRQSGISRSELSIQYRFIRSSNYARTTLLINW